VPNVRPKLIPRSAKDFKVGDEILYDRFPGTDEPLKGVVDEIYKDARGRMWIWVVCNGERFIPPVSKLKFDIEKETV